MMGGQLGGRYPPGEGHLRGHPAVAGQGAQVTFTGGIPAAELPTHHALAEKFASDIEAIYAKD
ncbi:hypothetical protein JHV675_51840 [Mycobacterium avium subsp. hominissuis]